MTSGSLAGWSPTSLPRRISIRRQSSQDQRFAADREKRIGRQRDLVAGL
jgi:hypothetical protein